MQLTRIMQLQQQFQENWEDEQISLKTHLNDKIEQVLSKVSNNGGNKQMSLKDELEMKNNSYEGIQEQINKLGEEVALDINDLEKRLN